MLVFSVGCRVVFFCKQMTAYEIRISDWSSDVCSSDLCGQERGRPPGAALPEPGAARRPGEEAQPALKPRDHLRGGVRAGEAGGIDDECGSPRLIVPHLHIGPGRLAVAGDVGCARLDPAAMFGRIGTDHRSEEHTPELQSLMRISSAVLYL